MQTIARNTTDIQAAKREVIKLGREKGVLTEDEIVELLPMEHIMEDELETLLFTLEMMSIEVRSRTGAKYTGAGQLKIIGRKH
jgi:hypothetical protein